MNRKRRLATVLTVLGIVAVVFAAPALGTEDGEEPAQISEEEEAEPAQISSDVEPAVPVTSPPEPDGTLDWTYRYMIPTALALAVLVIVITTIQYFTQVVRKRYRIVEE